MVTFKDKLHWLVSLSSLSLRIPKKMQPLILTTILLLSIILFSVARSQGEVLNIVEIQWNQTKGRTDFVVDEKNLTRILSKITPDTEIGVLSIAGEFRKGKSFILNFFLEYLQYLNAHQKNRPKREDMVLDDSKLHDSIRNRNHPWLRDIEKNFGFPFKSGIKRDTSGINVWSEPLIVPRESGKGLAILVMDSQGLYDKETSQDDNVKLFTLVSMLSSAIIMNTPGQINSEQLSQLHYFLKYASVGISIAPDVKLFQNISFLIRDYSLGDIEDDGKILTGWSAGHFMLKEFLDSEQPGVKSTGDALRRCFQGINCFPLPFPGEYVTQKDYDGSLQKMKKDFLAGVQTYVVDIVDKLHSRKVLLETLRGGNFLSHIMSITDKMNQGLSPEELIRLQESEMIRRVIDMVSALVGEHEDQLRKYVSNQKWLGFPDTTIREDITNKHRKMKDVTLTNVKQNATLCLPVGMESDKPVSGVDSLREKLNRRFEEVSYDLVASAIRARDDAQKIEDERIFRKIIVIVSALVREHEDKLRNYVSKKKWLEFTDSEIWRDITDEHRRMRDVTLTGAKLNPTLSRLIRLESGKSVTGTEYLREELDQRFEKIVSYLVESAKRARSNEVEEHIRWKQCKKNGWKKEPSKWCDKEGYCVSACSFLGKETFSCKTTQGSRWDRNFVRCKTAKDCSGCWKCAQPCTA